MAIVYFRRAVRLNKNDHSAWILLGHEYLEQTNCSMAIEAYSRGLGKAFLIILRGEGLGYRAL